MEFGVSFPSSPEAARQAREAEALGFASIGFIDSPALEADVWLTIAAALQATNRIKVGVEVLVPHLRHPVAQACAIATLAQMAPGRLYVGVGTGFTGRRVMGQKPLTWAYVAAFLRQLRGLLDGETVNIDGAPVRMLQPHDFVAARPVEVPFLVAANGPKGIAAARELGCGLIFGGPPEATPRDLPFLQIAGFGGVLLDEGEGADSPRVLEAAKLFLALQYHLALDGFYNPPLPIDQLPHGAEWLEMIERFPAETRHLHVHEHHMVNLNAHDRAFVEAHPDAVRAFAEIIALTPAQLRERLQPIGAAGADRVVCGALFQDWRADMRRYAVALGLSPYAGVL